MSIFCTLESYDRLIMDLANSYSEPISTCDSTNKTKQSFQDIQVDSIADSPTPPIRSYKDNDSTSIEHEKTNMSPVVVFSADKDAVSFHTTKSTPTDSNHLKNTDVAIQPVSSDNDFDEQSPYEEVAANVSNKDDSNTPCLTLRAWIISLLFTCLFSFVNQFFWYRTSPLFVGGLVAQLLSHLLGKIMAKLLPRRKFKIWRWSICLNPGPFTAKEHCIITAMASAAGVSLHFFKHTGIKEF